MTAPTIDDQASAALWGFAERARREIIQAPDARLLQSCLTVTDFDYFALHELATVMSYLRQKGINGVTGVGLAAPQVGCPVRVISLNPGKTSGYSTIVNPEIIAHGSNQSWGEEGCLSIEGGVRKFRVRRWDTVTVRFQTLRGETLERKASAFAARVLQHEIDHLSGKLISGYQQGACDGLGAVYRAKDRVRLRLCAGLAD